MALIKCSECKKEISDTVRKCPHCGFKNKKENTKLNDVINKIKSNKLYMIICGIVIILVIAFIICLYIAGEEKRIAMRAIEYLEDEDYDCDYEGEYDSFTDSYVCTLVENGEKHEFLIAWDNDFFYNLLDDSLNLEYKFDDGEVSYRLVNAHFYDRLNFVRLPGGCMYVPNGYNYSNNAEFGSKNNAVVESSCKKSNTEACITCREYLDTFNDSLNRYRDLYDELDIEI